MERNLGQWQAWCEAGETFKERKARLDQVPEQLRPIVLDHLKTVMALKKKAARKRAELSNVESACDEADPAFINALNRIADNDE